MEHSLQTFDADRSTLGLANIYKNGDAYNSISSEQDRLDRRSASDEVGSD